MKDGFQPELRVYDFVTKKSSRYLLKLVSHLLYQFIKMLT